MAEPRVLVLDEATSNLDLKSETLVEAALDVLLQGRTAVLIAHRLSTAMRADRIVVVGDGRLLEVGSHDELVALGGHYAEMYETWITQSHAGRTRLGPAPSSRRSPSYSRRTRHLAVAAGDADGGRRWRLEGRRRPRTHTRHRWPWRTPSGDRGGGVDLHVVDARPVQRLLPAQDGVGYRPIGCVVR